MTEAKEARAPRLKLNGEPTEDQLHQSIADLLKWILPDDVGWSHFPAGGYALSRGGGARLYRLGLTTGWPDLMITYSGGRTLWLEVKTRFGVTSRAQRKRHEQLQANGHPVVVVRRASDVIAALETYGVPFKKVRLADAYRATEGNEGAAQGRSPERAQASPQA